MRISILTTTIAVAALTNPLSMSAQQSPALREITSPTGGTVISPGQTVTVTVTSPANAMFDHIGLIGTGAIGIVNTLATSVPAQISVAIPADMTCRTHTLTARGTTTSGQDASARVLIDVEKPDMPWSISALLRQIIFDAQGDSSSIHLLGTFADGSVLDVTESSNVDRRHVRTACADCSADDSGHGSAASVHDLPKLTQFR